MKIESSQGLVLFDYWRSSASYRVRIALNLKGLTYDQHPVHLARGGGEQHGHEYREVNPQGLVPALAHEGGVITQSLAICEYLDEICPKPTLVSGTPDRRARIRAMAQIIACDIHPLNNLRVTNYLKGPLKQNAETVQAWYAHWIVTGFAAIEQQLAMGTDSGDFCFGDQPSLADCCLVPQVYNAERFECDMKPYPVIRRITAHCRRLPAFEAAQPEFQPDSPDI